MGMNDPADVEAVKIANQAFYTALSNRDAAAMADVWADADNVVNIGPLNDKIYQGRAEAVTDYWPQAFEIITKADVRLTSAPYIRTDGAIAVVVGTEHAEVTLAAGESNAFDVFVTNTFEKTAAGWKMMTHHAGVIPAAAPM